MKAFMFTFSTETTLTSRIKASLHPSRCGFFIVTNPTRDLYLILTAFKFCLQVKDEYYVTHIGR